MGSGNSSPVGRAETVETEAHQDLFEFRFDHMMMGGTTVLIIAILIAIWWVCKCRAAKKKKGRRRRRPTPSPSPRQFRHTQPPYFFPPPMAPMACLCQWAQPLQPWMMNSQFRGQNEYDDNRFIELPIRQAPEPPPDRRPRSEPRPTPPRPPLPSPTHVRQSEPDT